MTKFVFLILITILVSMSNTASVIAAPANETSGYDHMMCIFSVVACLNDQSLREESEGSPNNKFLYSVIGQVNSTKLIDRVVDLSSFHTRHAKSEYIENVAYWLKNELQSACNSKAYFHNFTQIDQGIDYNLKNIVCTQEGSAAYDNNHLILISAHYDSRMQNINQTNARAPGADDNASGVAAVLELVRILSKVNLKNNIQFVLFSGEEQGQWGSTSYVKHLQDNKTKVDLVLNLDMIGYPTQGLNNVVIEHDLGNNVTINDVHSSTVGQFIKLIALDYTNLETTFRPLGKTDLVPFEAAGNTVIGIHDGGSEGENPNYHNISDTPDTLNMEYLTLITELVLATILELDSLNQ